MSLSTKDPKSFYSIINEDLEDIEKNISALKDTVTSFVHSEIKDHALVCDNPEDFMSFIYSMFKISLRSNMEELETDIKKSKKWLSKNNIEDIDDSIKKIICDLDIYEKEMINYIDFEEQLPLLNKIKCLIENLNCKESDVKKYIHYGTFKTLFKSNKELKVRSIDFFDTINKLKVIDKNNEWMSITSSDFSFNDFEKKLQKNERSYSDVIYNINRLADELDNLRSQKDFYTKSLNKVENQNSKFFISELKGFILSLPIVFNKMDSILNYEFKHRNSGQLYKLISQIKVFEIIKDSFKNDKVEINYKNSNEEHYQIVSTSQEKSRWYRTSSNLILKFQNQYNYNEYMKSEKIIHDIFHYLSNNNLYTVGFYAIFGTILNNKKYQSLKEGDFDKVSIPY